jgi:hypothetical protein
MGGATVLEQAAVGKLREKKINDDLKVIETPEPFKFNIHVEGEKHYIVHFVNPSVFGQEFATLGKGPNHFTTKKDKETNSYFFNDEQLRNIVTGVEPAPTEGKMASSMTQAVTPSPSTGPILIPPKTQAVTASPCTGPIIIPPRVWDK